MTGEKHFRSKHDAATRWSLILRAQGSGSEAAAALEELLRLYWEFLLFLIRVNRHPPDSTAQDLAQEFVAGVIRRNDIQKLDRRRGSFRAWLRTSVRYFLSNEWNRWRRRPHLETEGLYEEFQAHPPEDALCEQAFLAFVLLRARALTRDESSDKARFDQIVRFLPGPDADFDDVAGLAAKLRIRPNTLSKFIFDARQRFWRNVDATILETLDFSSDGSNGGAASLRALEEEKAALRRSLEPIPNGVVRML